MFGRYHGLVEVKPLIEDIAFPALLADKAFDADWLLKELDGRGVKAVILPKANRIFDHCMYKWWYLIENYFYKLKEFKRIAMHSGKTGSSFTAMVYLCASVINSR